MPTPDSTPGTTGGQDASLLKVLENWDALALGFGAMIGFGWVLLTGAWISAAGTGGAVLAMVTGGVIMSVVGLTYAQLTAAMPRREASSTSYSGAWAALVLREFVGRRGRSADWSSSSSSSRPSGT